MQSEGWMQPMDYTWQAATLPLVMPSQLISIGCTIYWHVSLTKIEPDEHPRAGGVVLNSLEDASFFWRSWSSLNYIGLLGLLNSNNVYRRSFLKTYKQINIQRTGIMGLIPNIWAMLVAPSFARLHIAFGGRNSARYSLVQYWLFKLQKALSPRPVSGLSSSALTLRHPVSQQKPLS